MVANDDHGRAIELMRDGEWGKAAELLAPLAAPGADPWLINDLAVALHQAGRAPEAVEKLRALAAGPLPALIRLRRTYLEKAAAIASGFDPRWVHHDHDGAACPSRPPLVSVIVRTFQRPELLREALMSLKDQTMTAFEAIVVNDGGDPASEAVVKQSGIPNARYVMMPHGGRVRALNAGLEMAHGKYVTGLDDDDVLLPHHLAALTGYLESPGAAPVAYGDYRMAEYRRDAQGSPGPASARDVIAGEYKKGVLFETNPCTILLMARRECYEKVGRFIPALELAEDWEMWLRLAEHYDFHHVPAVTAEVRLQPGDLNLTARRLREKYYYDNLVIVMHRGLPVLSAPQRPELTAAYRKGLAMLDALARERPDVLPLLNLRGLWEMNKPYAWFADQGRWMMQLGERNLAARFYQMALRLAPGEPKLWAGWLKAMARKGR